MKSKYFRYMLWGNSHEEIFENILIKYGYFQVEIMILIL